MNYRNLTSRKYLVEMCFGKMFVPSPFLQAALNGLCSGLTGFSHLRVLCPGGLYRENRTLLDGAIRGAEVRTKLCP